MIIKSYGFKIRYVIGKTWLLSCSPATLYYPELNAIEKEGLWLKIGW